MGGLLAGLFIIYISVIIVIAGEGLIINAVNNAGLSGITGVLLMAALPGSLVLYFLGKLNN